MSEQARKILAGLAEPFPPHLIESRPGGGGKHFQYVKGWAVVERLNNVTPEWSTEVKWRQIQDMDLYEYNKQANRNEVVTRPVMMIEMDLSIPYLGTRTGLGVQIMRPGSEDMVKGAWTDALKVAASKFMVAHDLYKAGAGDGPQDTGGDFGGNQYQNQGGGGSEPPTEKQWGTLNRLANKLKIDKNQIAMQTTGKGVNDLDKNTISPVIKRLMAIDNGSEQWNPGGNLAQAARQQRPSQPAAPVVDENGVIQEDSGGGDAVENWINTIGRATTGTQLDKIYESLKEYGLESDQRLIDALEARNAELPD